MRLNSNVGKNKISRDFESDAKLSPGAASTPTFLFFVGFSVFPLRTQKHEKRDKKFSNLAVNYSDVVFFSRRETLGMFIVVVPVVQWRRSGRGKGGGG